MLLVGTLINRIGAIVVGIAANLSNSRITEASDVRITEAGDIRITEGA